MIPRPRTHISTLTMSHDFIVQFREAPLISGKSRLLVEFHVLWNSRKFSQTIWTNSLCWDWGLALLFWDAKCNYNLDSSGSCSVHCGGPMETCEPCLWNAVQLISLCQFHSNVRIHPFQISPDQMRVKLPSEDDFDVHTKMIWISSIYTL